MILLMNSAMMPSDGTYSRKTVTKEVWRKLFQTNKSSGFKNYIGYADACKYASSILDEEIVLSREETDFRVGDIALILKLKYRVLPESKNQNVHYSEKDYEFIVVEKKS